jgi:hypothetical protein
METYAEKRIPVIKLLTYKSILKQLNSFSAKVVKCNFTTHVGWRGKTYVDKHDVCEYNPELRGVELLDVHYLVQTDSVVLTDDQYDDYRIIAGLDHLTTHNTL